MHTKDLSYCSIFISVLHLSFILRAWTTWPDCCRAVCYKCTTFFIRCKGMNNLTGLLPHGWHGLCGKIQSTIIDCSMFNISGSSIGGSLKGHSQSSTQPLSPVIYSYQLWLEMIHIMNTSTDSILRRRSRRRRRKEEEENKDKEGK